MYSGTDKPTLACRVRVVFAFEMCASILRRDLGGNALSGTIPNGISSLTKLTILYVMGGGVIVCDQGVADRVVAMFACDCVGSRLVTRVGLLVCV